MKFILVVLVGLFVALLVSIDHSTPMTVSHVLAYAVGAAVMYVGKEME